MSSYRSLNEKEQNTSPQIGCFSAVFRACLPIAASPSDIIQDKSPVCENEEMRELLSVIFEETGSTTSLLECPEALDTESQSQESFKTLSNLPYMVPADQLFYFQSDNDSGSSGPTSGVSTEATLREIMQQVGNSSALVGATRHATASAISSMSGEIDSFRTARPAPQEHSAHSLVDSARIVTSVSKASIRNSIDSYDSLTMGIEATIRRERANAESIVQQLHRSRTCTNFDVIRNAAPSSNPLAVEIQHVERAADCNCEIDHQGHSASNTRSISGSTSLAITPGNEELPSTTKPGTTSTSAQAPGQTSQSSRNQSTPPAVEGSESDGDQPSGEPVAGESPQDIICHATTERFFLPAESTITVRRISRNDAVVDLRADTSSFANKDTILRSAHQDPSRCHELYKTTYSSGRGEEGTREAFKSDTIRDTVAGISSTIIGASSNDPLLNEKILRELASGKDLVSATIDEHIDSVQQFGKRGPDVQAFSESLESDRGVQQAGDEADKTIQPSRQQQDPDLRIETRSLVESILYSIIDHIAKQIDLPVAEPEHSDIQDGSNSA